ncbi:MAG: hypothetical protein FJY77_01250, partial [Candidatus Altiarchaeales archaeon]|nr:hypothetical protein [Candidatus Altiarchaeales archaeon]
MAKTSKRGLEGAGRLSHPMILSSILLACVLLACIPLTTAQEIVWVPVGSGCQCQGMGVSYHWGCPGDCPGGWCYGMCQQKEYCDGDTAYIIISDEREVVCQEDGGGAYCLLMPVDCKYNYAFNAYLPMCVLQQFIVDGTCGYNPYWWSGGADLWAGHFAVCSTSSTDCGDSGCLDNVAINRGCVETDTGPECWGNRTDCSQAFCNEWGQLVEPGNGQCWFDYE